MPRGHFSTGCQATRALGLTNWRASTVCQRYLVAGTRIAKSYWIVGLAVGASLPYLCPGTVGPLRLCLSRRRPFLSPVVRVRASRMGGPAACPCGIPNENLGQPLAGDATSGVFYPGKLLFALPLDYTLLFNVYVVAHVALAAYTSYPPGSAPRRIACSPPAWPPCPTPFPATCCFSIPTSCSWSAQAWLPLALELADRMLRNGSWRAAAVGMGVVLALIVTGGDPQMAYNAGLLGKLDAADPVARDDADVVAAVRPLLAVSLLATAATVGLLLAAVQILPSWEAAQHSLRSVHTAPRNVLRTGRRRPSFTDADAMTRHAGTLACLAAANDEHTRHHLPIQRRTLAGHRVRLAQCLRTPFSDQRPLAGRPAGGRTRVDAVALHGLVAVRVGSCHVWHPPQGVAGGALVELDDAAGRARAAWAFRNDMVGTRSRRLVRRVDRRNWQVMKSAACTG